jgi:hypothetical protein
MKKLDNNQLGFGALGIIVIVLVLAAVGAAGWMVYKNQNKKTSSDVPKTNSDTNNHQTADNTPDPTSSWKRIESIGNAYSIKIPDGWELTNYPGNTIHGDNITLSTGKPAVITTANSAYAGDTRKFNVAFTDKQYDAPQWQPPSDIGTVTTTDYSIGSLKGKRYSIEYTQTVTGATKGDKIYQYVFNLSSGQQLDIVYMQNAGDADNLKTVEQAIQTIVINE